MTNFDIDDIKSIDLHNMFAVISEFPEQVSKALEIGESAPTFKITPRNILILGMGGSAIGGDLVRSFLQNIPEFEKLNIVINRNYNIPKYVDDSWCVIASSYSGNTEETLSGFDKVKESTSNIICLTTGGKLEKLAIEHGLSIVNVPTGLQPRCALGYGFFIILKIISRSINLSEETQDFLKYSIKETQHKLEKKSLIYSQIDDENPAIKLANQIYGNIPTIYSATEGTDVVNMRWRGQFQENAKNLAFGGLLPEANHNDICGWIMPEDLQDRFKIIFMEDDLDNERVKLRFEALKSIYESLGKEVILVKGKGKYLLTRIFDLIYLADWTSFYLAMLNNVDPTPIPLISQLKKYLDSYLFLDN
jgi:glucose/mannose-6-phosphate isomerase